MVMAEMIINMEKDVGLSILQSNGMQVGAHSGLNESQEKGSDGISAEEQKRSTRSHTIKHLRLKPNVNKKIFRCPDCDKVFTCVKNMLDHSAVCRSSQGTNQSHSCDMFKDTIKCSYVSNKIPALIKCAICSASYISEDAFMGHMASYHGTHERITIPTIHSDHLIACTFPKCDFKASTDVILQAHIDAYHIKKHHQISIKYKGVKPFLPYKCQYCDASYVVESILRRHMKTHNKSKKEIRNGSCKNITLSHKEITRKDSMVACVPEDVNIVNEVQVVFHCEYCGKTVSGANEFANHLKKHSVKKISYKMQKEECASSHDNVMYPGIKKVKCTRKTDCVNIDGDVSGDGECSAQEVEEHTFPREDSDVGLNILAMKHNQKHVKAEIDDKEFLDTCNVILSDDECVDVNIAVEQDNTRKNSVLMKCNFCNAAFVSENFLRKHLQKHKNKENKLKKYGWFGWELHSNSAVSQDHSVSNSEDEVQNLCSTQEASSQKVLEIKCEEVNESFGSENISVSKSYIDKPMKILYPAEVKEENCSIGDYCMTDSKEMVKTDIKEEPELEKIDLLKEELE